MEPNGSGGTVFETYIQPLVIEHGYWAVFLVILLEGVGLPLPGEAALLLAAVYAGATGELLIAYVIAAAIAGAIIGGGCGYWIGRWMGESLLERYGRFLGLTPNRLQLGQYLFARHGAKIIFFGRFVAILRVFAAVLAGLNKYSWQQFLIFNSVASVVWALVMGGCAYLFGDAMTRVSGPLGIIALALVVGGVFVSWLVLRRQEKKWEDRLAAVAAGEEHGDR
jgi:membrane protein DedA with SNARE-associated domain